MRKLHGLVVLAATALTPQLVSAQAVISNGVVRLGVNATGQLNYDGVGVASVATGNDATVYGCECEGWGAGVSGGGFTGTAGWFNDAIGHGGTTVLNSFSSTATTATSVVTIKSGATDVMKVTHYYHPSANPNLYQVDVSIENLTGGTLGTGTDGIRYRRVMDWDIAPTAFDEYVNMYTGGASNVLYTSNNGFATSNPFGGESGGSGCSTLLTGEYGFYGPDDCGAHFDFGFAALDAGGILEFTTFYGTAGTIDLMTAALADVEAEVYSMAHCNPAGDSSCTFDGDPNTFAFGFKGVGGDPIEVVPDPITMTLLGTGLVGIAAARRRRRQQQ
jgi:type IV pilus assembly protein PilY1